MMVKRILLPLALLLLVITPVGEAKKGKPEGASAETRSDAPVQPPAGGYSTAEKCGQCHSDIYENWRGSLHAAAFQNPIFQAAYRKVYTESRGEAGAYCLRCHAPLAELLRDFNASSGLAREGVTCDFCHNVKAVVKKGRGLRSFTVSPGVVKSSSLKGANPKKHKAAYSADFASSELCAGCHEFVNKNGVPVGTTYREWKASRFAAEGKRCQECHMAAIAGKTANEDGRDGMHDHSLAHSMDKMMGAVKVESKGLTVVQGKAMAEALITNVGSGHAIPTGTPARMLVLEARAMDAAGRVIETKKKVYRKRVLDAKGNELTADGDAFWYGKKISTDNRLNPGETRAETFYFSTPPDNIASITAEAYLLYTPMVTMETEMKIPLGAVSRKVE